MREYSIGTILDISEDLDAGFVSLLSEGRDRVTFAAGDTIYHQGDPADGVFFLLSGTARSVLVSPAGNPCLLRMHLSHSLLGLTSLSAKAVRDADAVATSDCICVKIPAESFLDLMRSHPDFAVHVIRMLVDRMSDFHHRVGDFLTRTVEERLAATLLSISRSDPREEDPSQRRPIDLTHEELANLLGSRRPTITAILNSFSSDGSIERRGRTIRVVDPDRLAKRLFND